MTKRQEPDGGTERNDAQPQLLTNFAAIDVDEIPEDAGRRALVVPNAQAAIEEFSEANRIFGAERAGREVTNTKEQRVFDTAQVVDEHIVLVACVEASRHERSERKIQRLLGKTRRRCK